MPQQLTPIPLEELVRCIRAGNSVRVACGLVGYHPKTLAYHRKLCPSVDKVIRDALEDQE